MTLRQCLNWKVLVGLGGAAALILIIAPRAAGFVPLLLLLACPLSMVAMMWSMRAAPKGEGGAPGSLGSEERIADLKAQVAALQADRDGEVERITSRALTR